MVEYARDLFEKAKEMALTAEPKDNKEKRFVYYGLAKSGERIEINYFETEFEDSGHGMVSEAVQILGPSLDIGLRYEHKKRNGDKGSYRQSINKVPQDGKIDYSDAADPYTEQCLYIYLTELFQSMEPDRKSLEKERKRQNETGLKESDISGLYGQ